MSKKIWTKEIKLAEEKFPLKLLEIVFTTFLIAATFNVLWKMGDAEYDLIIFFSRASPIYIPILYVAWIFKISYTRSDLLSNPKMNKSLYYVSVITVGITLAQIQEVSPLLQETLSVKMFINLYSSKCLFHPLFTALLILLFLNIRHNIVGEEKHAFFWANILLISAFIQPVIKNAYNLLLALLETIGISQDGADYSFFIFYGLVFALFAASTLGKSLAKKFKKDSEKEKENTP